MCNTARREQLSDTESERTCRLAGVEHDTGTPGDGAERRLPEGRWPHRGLVKGAAALGL